MIGGPISAIGPQTREQRARARHRLPESTAELSPWAGRAMGLALLPAPIARRRGLRGSGETRSLGPQAPGGGGKPVLARTLHPAQGPTRA